MMQIAQWYSHLNGWEYLKVHREVLWFDVKSIIEDIDAEACRTKISQEQRLEGRRLYSPVAMNKAFAKRFEERGWAERRNTFWVTADEKLMRGIYNLDEADQKQRIEEAGRTPIKSYNQTDFIKDRVAVEVQLGKYALLP